MTALWRMGHQRSVMRITSASDDDRRLAGDPVGGWCNKELWSVVLIADKADTVVAGDFEITKELCLAAARLLWLKAGPQQFPTV
jgi:hypothetical protein